MSTSRTVVDAIVTDDEVPSTASGPRRPERVSVPWNRMRIPVAREIDARSRAPGAGRRPHPNLHPRRAASPHLRPKTRQSDNIPDHTRTSGIAQKETRRASAKEQEPPQPGREGQQQCRLVGDERRRERAPKFAPIASRTSLAPRTPQPSRRRASDRLRSGGFPRLLAWQGGAVDAIVVGGGSWAAAAARQLARRGSSVVVLEQSEPEYHSGSSQRRFADLPVGLS